MELFRSSATTKSSMSIRVINEISKTSSPDLEIQDMMTIDLHNISMVSTTYDKTVKVGITLPGSLTRRQIKLAVSRRRTRDCKHDT
jgi:hypothetical protein